MNRLEKLYENAGSAATASHFANDLSIGLALLSRAQGEAQP